MSNAEVSSSRLALQPPAELAELYHRKGYWDGRSLEDVLLEGCREHAGMIVRVHSDTRPYQGTVGELADGARRLANALSDLGLGPGDAIAFQLPNWVEGPISFWGFVFAGITIVPVPHFYGPYELSFIIRQSGARALIIANRFGKRDYLAEVEALRPELPNLEHVICVRSGLQPLPRWALDFASLTTGEPVSSLVKPRAESIAVVGYTSGTSAHPKGVMLTHRALVFEMCMHMSRANEKGSPVLQGSPVTHVTGMLVSLLMPLVFGQPIHLIDVWNPDRVMPALIEHDLSVGNGAPIFLTSVLDHRDFTPAHTAGIKGTALGGSPVPPSIVERAARLGIVAWRIYGCTEHPTISSGCRQDSLHHRSCTDGRVLPGAEVRIVNESGRILSSGQRGQIQSRGPDLCAGYIDQTLNGAFDKDGWFSTGDIGMLDEAGFLTVTDRVKDIIIRGGENISASEVESMLVRFESIAEAAVVAMPDVKYGERACAFVRIKPGRPAPNLDAIRVELQRLGLAKVKWPEEVIVVEEFPRTPSGKIKKYVLKEQLSQRSTTSA
jgi:acyl-CoA synthetase